MSEPGPPWSQYLAGTASALVLSSMMACAGGDAVKTAAQDVPVPGAAVTAPPRDLHGSDISVVGQQAPGGVWAPMQMRHAYMAVTVRINGLMREAILDTGAMCTVVDIHTAGLLALKPVVGAKKTALFDAAGEKSEGIVGRAETIEVEGEGGVFSLGAADICVVNETLLDGKVLLGLDVLRKTDLVVVPDEYVIGFYPPGLAPRFHDEITLPLSWDKKKRTLLTTFAPLNNDFAVQGIIDTGATFTQLDVRVGLKARLKTKVQPIISGQSLKGKTETRGQFMLDNVIVGGHNVGPLTVRPWGQAFGAALLGLDIWFSYRTVISAHDAQIRIHPRAVRPAVRARRSNGKACTNDFGAEVPCVSVKLDAGASSVEPRLCYAAYNFTEPVEFAVRLYDAQSEPVLSRGGAMVIQAQPRRNQGCMAQRGFLRTAFQRAARVELVWVRSPPRAWYCGQSDGCVQQF